MSPAAGSGAYVREDGATGVCCKKELPFLSKNLYRNFQKDTSSQPTSAGGGDSCEVTSRQA